MSDPDREPTEKPTHDSAEAEHEGRWMARNWLAIAAVSILGVLLLAIGIMQATGLMALFAPVADTETQQWGVFAILVLAWLVVAGWSWSAVTA